MTLKNIPLVLFAGAAILFGFCAVLQFTSGSVALGLLFAVLAVVGIVMFFVLRSGRITL
ncbi:hypothetical protein OSC27_10835 [Microbacterium sp. STN6]|uniref:hypothetical protein n=1 Tax=Microbacterium sp. STN6 TaxID=2995588 RepID=UPI002260A47B|nr:hypothetical protein [Microbacterium sp. STN6]MCX7522768.1 hypothetical protein [Microbacterium sp. STN6]